MARAPSLAGEKPSAVGRVSQSSHRPAEPGSKEAEDAIGGRSRSITPPASLLALGLLVPPIVGWGGGGPLPDPAAQGFRLASAAVGLDAQPATGDADGMRIACCGQRVYAVIAAPDARGTRRTAPYPGLGRPRAGDMPDTTHIGPLDGPLDAPPPVEGESISGAVTDFDGMPLVGVRVEVADGAGADLDLLPVLTDGDGAFEVTGLAPGARYDLRFKLGTVKARTLAVPVGTDQLRIKLARPQGIMLVIKTGSGDPPPDLYGVVLERDASPRPIREYFGRGLRSRMLLWSIRPGRYTVIVWGGPYLPVRAHGVMVAEAQSAPQVEVLLSARGGEVDVGVSDAKGRACPALISWRRVGAVDPVPRHMTTHTTDLDGRFAIRGLPEGRYRISALGADQGLAHAEVDVREDLPATLGLRLS